MSVEVLMSSLEMKGEGSRGAKLRGKKTEIGFAIDK